MDNSTADVFSTYLTPRRPQDFQCFESDYSTSALDRRHRFTGRCIYDMPFFKNGNWALKNVVGNWQFTPVYTFQSPEYATVQSGVDTNLNGDTAGDRAIYNPAGVAGTRLRRDGAEELVLADCRAISRTTRLRSTSGAGRVRSPTAAATRMAMPRINNCGHDLHEAHQHHRTQSFEFPFQALNLFNHAQYVPGYISDVAPIGYTGPKFYTSWNPSGNLVQHANQVFSNHPRNMVLA